MKSETLEKCGWLALLVFIVSVFCTVLIWRTNVAYKNGHKNLHTVEIWMPSTAKMVSMDELNTMTSVTNVSDVQRISILSFEQYKSMTAGQTVYVGLSCVFDPTLEYWAKIGQAWVYHRQRYPVEKGASSVIKVNYIGDSKLEVRTVYTKSDFCASIIGALIMGVICAVVLGMLALVLIGGLIMSRIVDKLRRREWDEAANERRLNKIKAQKAEAEVSSL